MHNLRRGAWVHVPHVPPRRSASAYTYIHTHTYRYTHTHISMYTHTHKYIHIYIHTHTHIYTYIHTYIYIHIGRGIHYFLIFLITKIEMTTFLIHVLFNIYGCFITSMLIVANLCCCL